MNPETKYPESAEVLQNVCGFFGGFFGGGDGFGVF